MAARRRNNTKGSPTSTTGRSAVHANGAIHSDVKDTPTLGKNKPTVGVSQVLPAIFDFYSALLMLFGGCCSNVVFYEQLLNMNPRFGSALTFCQTLFIAVQSMPSFLMYPKNHILPQLKPRQVPITQWALQVLVLTSGSLLNNWAFAYNVPLTIFIVFRSAGLPVSVLFGYFVLKKRYTLIQLISIAIVTAGVIIVTFSKATPGAQTQKKMPSQDELKVYAIGISMLTISLFCSGLLGILQEQTYTKYGPCWKEGVFYTHLLSLPIFVFLGRDIKQGMTSLYDPSSTTPAIQSFAILAGNLITQLFCVSGVNRLTSQVSSVSTNIALTVRKALSLCFSVWWFGNDWNAHLGIGAFMVFFGSLMYTLNVDKIHKKD